MSAMSYVEGAIPAFAWCASAKNSKKTQGK